MNTKNETENPAENRETRTKAPYPEPSEPEPTVPNDSSDSRETAERGYGWGV